MKKDGTFELGDPVKIVDLSNPYNGSKGVFIGYTRVNFQETRLTVLLEDRDEREHSFGQGEVESDIEE